MRELVIRIADDFGLTPAEREERLPGGSTTTIASRVHWAKTYLKRAGLVEQPTRGVVRVTQRGRDVLASNPARIDIRFLERFPEFQSFIGRTKSANTAPEPASTHFADAIPNTPEEQMAAASKILDESLRDALLTRVLEMSPSFFEKMIIDLLLAMGYGGSRTDAGERIGRSGDGGVDGVIREDQLGLDRVYLQAKRYQPGNAIGSEAVRAFIGALIGKGAQQGVFITTSSFTKDARSTTAQSGGLRIVLIDGAELADFMLRFGVGVRVYQTVEIKRIDLEYFDETEVE